MKPIMISLFIFLCSNAVSAQFGYGPVKGFDYYQSRTFVKAKNATDPTLDKVESILLNGVFGYKSWVGNSAVSLSLESQINIGLANFSNEGGKSTFVFSIPLLAKVNIGGVSGFGNKKRLEKGKYSVPGLSMGIGFQVNSDDVKGSGYFFNTLIYELGVGIGNGIKSTVLTFRIGEGKDNTETLNIGLIHNLNKKGMR